MGLQSASCETPHANLIELAAFRAKAIVAIPSPARFKVISKSLLLPGKTIYDHFDDRP